MYSIGIKASKSQFHQYYLKLCIKSTYRIQRFRCGKTFGERWKKEWLRRGLSNIFGKYLVITNTISSGILMSVGDLIQQEFEYLKHEKHKDSFDWRRNINMGIVGTLLGPFVHFFYQILDAVIPGSNFRSVAQKILLDQTIASPICILIFFFGMNYLNNVEFKTSKLEVKMKFWLIYAVSKVFARNMITNYYFLVDGLLFFCLVLTSSLLF